LKNNPLIYQIILALLICLSVSAGRPQILTANEGVKTIAVLPFKINAAQELTHIREGILHMFYSRLSWRDKVIVVPPGTIKKYLSEITDTSKTFKISDMAKLTQSDYVLAGTLTSLGGSFSIDVRVYDIENKRHMAFFEQSPKKDDLINKVSRIAATINKKIFDRDTGKWEKMEEEKQAYIKEMKRKNPEYMMKTHQWKDTEESPGWRIWEYLF